MAMRERIDAFRRRLSLAVFGIGLLAVPVAHAQTGATVGGNGIAHETDYAGNDIFGRDIAGGDWAACQAMCMAEPRCVVWTLYTPPPGNVGGCWLKHTKGVASANQYSISGERALITSPGDTGVDPSAPSSLRQ